MTSDRGNGLGERLQQLTRSQLEWDTIPIPWYIKERMNSDDEHGILHLGFGDKTMADGGPEEGRRYLSYSRLRTAIAL